MFPLQVHDAKRPGRHGRPPGPPPGPPEPKQEGPGLDPAPSVPSPVSSGPLPDSGPTSQTQPAERDEEELDELAALLEEVLWSAILLARGAAGPQLESGAEDGTPSLAL